MNLEESVLNVELVKGMKAGVEGMKVMTVDVESVDDLKDDLAEANDLAEELNEVLSVPFVEMDEDDLLSELNELEELEAETDLEDLPEVIGLPLGKDVVPQNECDDGKEREEEKTL